MEAISKRVGGRSRVLNRHLRDWIVSRCHLDSSDRSANRQVGYNQPLMKKSWIYVQSGSHICIINCTVSKGIFLSLIVLVCILFTDPVKMQNAI